MVNSEAAENARSDAIRYPHCQRYLTNGSTPAAAVYWQDSKHRRLYRGERIEAESGVPPEVTDATRDGTDFLDLRALSERYPGTQFTEQVLARDPEATLRLLEKSINAPRAVSRERRPSYL